MCVIIDACVAQTVIHNPAYLDFVPLLNWIGGADADGCLVYGGKLAQELSACKRVRRYLRTLNQAGRAIHWPDSEVATEDASVRSTGLCTSNDTHVIALARVSGARTLCTSDGNLEKDFKNRDLIAGPRGKIYKCAAHAHLLKHTTSCRTARSALSQARAMI